MQQQLFLKQEQRYGGELLKKRKGRLHGRPLSTKYSMHLVLRSSKAKGNWSFLRPENSKKIKGILNKFAAKYGIKLLHGANVGNHIHLEIQLTNRQGYKPFIRAITSAIAMKITGISRWNSKEDLGLGRFWDLRPFTRIVVGLKSQLTLRDYIKINRLEGRGIQREVAHVLIKRNSINFGYS